MSTNIPENPIGVPKIYKRSGNLFCRSLGSIDFSKSLFALWYGVEDERQWEVKVALRLVI